VLTFGVAQRLFLVRLSKEMSSLHVGLGVFCLLEGKAQEFDAVYTSLVLPVFHGKRLCVQLIFIHSPSMGGLTMITYAYCLFMSPSMLNSKGFP
jgi:hypothetical protein